MLLLIPYITFLLGSLKRSIIMEKMVKKRKPNKKGCEQPLKHLEKCLKFSSLYNEGIKCMGQLKALKLCLSRSEKTYRSGP